MDESTPLARNIRRIGHIDIPGGGQIVVQDGYAYVGHMKPPFGTTILDVSDPENPRVASQIMLPDAYSHTHKVRVVGDLMVTNVEQNSRHLLRKGDALPLSRYMSRVTLVSTTYMSPMIIAFTLVGSFVPREYLFDMYLAFAFGFLGYLARKTGYHVAAILIGVILGPLLEQYMLRALKMSDGNVWVLFSSPLGNILWVLLILALVVPPLVKHRRLRRGETVFSEGEG